MQAVVCPDCGNSVTISDFSFGPSVACPACGGDIAARRLGADSAADPPIVSAQRYPAMKRRLAIVQVRQKLRALCDRVGLGPSTEERCCCALIAAVVPFALSFVLACLLHEAAGYAALQGVGSFALVALFGVLLVRGKSDDELEALRTSLTAKLPLAAKAWRQRKYRRRQSEPDLEPFGAEDEEVEVVRSQRSRRAGGDVHVHIHGAGKSGGTAAVLEVLFGLFFQTFGIGHMYAGNVAAGLMLMFGYWGFVLLVPGLVFLLVVVLGIVSGGIGFVLLPLVFVIWPAVWFLTMIVSPIIAANSV